MERKLEYLRLAEFLESGVWVEHFHVLFELAKTAIKTKDGIFFLGNGGSAAEATHLAAEFIGKCVKVHEPWPAQSLTDSISAITAISNDWSFDEVFSRQVKALARPNSLFIALTTSGKSRNVIEALKIAKELGSKTAVLTTESGSLNCSQYSDVSLNVPTASTPRAQEIHLFWGHLLAEMLELDEC